MDAIEHTASPFHTNLKEPDGRIPILVRKVRADHTYPRLFPPCRSRYSGYAEKRTQERVSLGCIVDHQLTDIFFRTQVKRVVITSSCAAVMDPPSKPTIFSENDWNETSPRLVEEQGSKAAPLTVYRASKTLAEKGTNA